MMQAYDPSRLDISLAYLLEAFRPLLSEHVKTWRCSIFPRASGKSFPNRSRSAEKRVKPCEIRRCPNLLGIRMYLTENIGARTRLQSSCRCHSKSRHTR